MNLIAQGRAGTKILAAIGLVTVGALVGGATAALRSPAFDTVTARRIDIVDANGTLRMAIFNGARTPEARVRGKVYPRTIGDTAGFILFDPQGREVGGLATSRADGAAN